MRNYILILVLSILSTFNSLGCGADIYYDDSDYFAFFNRRLISNPYYLDYLYSSQSQFREQLPSANRNKYTGNINLWIKSFPHWTQKDLEQLLFTSHLDELKTKYTKAIDRSIFEYVNFAKTIPTTSQNNSHAWTYSSYLKQNISTAESIIESGIQKYNIEKNKALKQRYAYLIIKLLRYNKDYQGALYFFESEKLDTYKHNELYYYSLDQIAGCHYYLKEYNTAIKQFIQVYTHSSDRKISAYRSYKFCLNHTNLENVFKNKDEILDYYVLRSLSNFDDGISILNKMKSVRKQDERIEVVFAKQMNYLDQLNSLTNTKKEASTIQFIQDLKTFSKSMFKTKNKVFWKYSYQYLLGLEGKYDEAIDGLKLITDSKYIQDRDALILLFNALQWKSITDIDQIFFNRPAPLNSPELESVNTIHHYIKHTILSRLFINEELYAQAYLIHNQIGQNRITDMELIESLIAFINNPNKTPLDKTIIKTQNSNQLLENLYRYKGNLYINEGQFTEATQSFKQAIETADIPNSIFSNTLQTCYNCTESSMMTDSVYLAKPFDFIPQQMSSYDLAQVLVKLEAMSKDIEHWKGQLAHYLLGNFYNNISNTGYYRGKLWGEHNCCDYYYMKDSWMNNYSDPITYPNNITYYNHSTSVYYSLAINAQKYYQTVLESSNNIELKARTTFLLAQCEWNDIENNNREITYHNYNHSIISFDSHEYNTYKTLFDSLNSTYKNTKFHTQIIKECSYFRLYTQ